MTDIEALIKMMEEMANAPKEPIGKREPGERCGYEKPIRRPRVGPELYEEL